MGREEGFSGLSERAQAFSVQNLLFPADKNDQISGQVKWNRGVGVELCAKELWEEFAALGTEMLVTKAGRRMFPTIKVRFHGLSSSRSYIVFMDVVPASRHRFRYMHLSGEWLATTVSTDVEEEPQLGSQIYVHPDSPASGQVWTSQGHVSFLQVKLTNNTQPVVMNQITLQSMRQYLPRIHVLEVPADLISRQLPTDKLIDYVEKNRLRASVFSYPVTAFFTVTAYQNPRITTLKIHKNPFAKGYRELFENGGASNSGKANKECRTQQEPENSLKNTSLRTVPVTVIYPPPI